MRKIKCLAAKKVPFYSQISPDFSDNIKKWQLVKQIG
jgi:hypothetical protein